MSISDVEAKIRSAVADAKARGWKVRPCNYVSWHNKTCCPLAACVIEKVEQYGNQPGVDSQIRGWASEALGIRVIEALDFVVGFDNENALPYGNDFRDLGRRLQDVVDR